VRARSLEDPGVHPTFKRIIELNFICIYFITVKISKIVESFMHENQEVTNVRNIARLNLLSSDFQGFRLYVLLIQEKHKQLMNPVLSPLKPIPYQEYIIIMQQKH
jgi:hypothetical protein